MTYKDKGSYESSPPCTVIVGGRLSSEQTFEKYYQLAPDLAVYMRRSAFCFSWHFVPADFASAGMGGYD